MAKPKKRPKKKSRYKKTKDATRRKSKEQRRKEREQRRKEREIRKMLRDLGREISEISKELLEGQTDTKPGWAWGTPFVQIGPCDGSCNSPLHKKFVIEMFDGENFFHCTHDELRDFANCEVRDFLRIGEFAMLKDEIEANALLGWEISKISSEILSNEELLNIFRSGEARMYGSPFVIIRTCEEEVCDSPLHKYFMVLLYDGEFAFHCDFEELVNFSQIDEADDFISLGEYALTEVAKEQVVTEQQERGISVDVVTSEEVDAYLAEHPELIDQPSGRAQAIAKVSSMKKKRIKEAKKSAKTEETDDN